MTKAKDKKVNLAEKSAEELKANVKSLKEESMKLRFQKATGQLQNTARMKEIRREVARSKTILTQQAQAADSEN